MGKFIIENKLIVHLRWHMSMLNLRVGLSWVYYLQMTDNILEKLELISKLKELMMMQR